MYLILTDRDSFNVAGCYHRFYEWIWYNIDFYIVNEDVIITFLYELGVPKYGKN